MLLTHHRKFSDGPAYNEECVCEINQIGMDCIEVTAHELKANQMALNHPRKSAPYKEKTIEAMLDSFKTNFNLKPYISPIA